MTSFLISFRKRDEISERKRQIYCKKEKEGNDRWEFGPELIGGLIQKRLNWLNTVINYNKAWKLKRKQRKSRCSKKGE